MYVDTWNLWMSSILGWVRTLQKLAWNSIQNSRVIKGFQVCIHKLDIFSKIPSVFPSFPPTCRRFIRLPLPTGICFFGDCLRIVLWDSSPSNHHHLEDFVCTDARVPSSNGCANELCVGSPEGVASDGCLIFILARVTSCSGKCRRWPACERQRHRAPHHMLDRCTLVLLARTVGLRDPLDRIFQVTCLGRTSRSKPKRRPKSQRPKAGRRKQRFFILTTEKSFTQKVQQEVTWESFLCFFWGWCFTMQ